MGEKLFYIIITVGIVVGHSNNDSVVQLTFCLQLLQESEERNAALMEEIAALEEEVDAQRDTIFDLQQEILSLQKQLVEARQQIPAAEADQAE